jgi:hypothetical protein
VEKAFQERKGEMEPNLSSAKIHFIAAFKQLGQALKKLFNKK